MFNLETLGSGILALAVIILSYKLFVYWDKTQTNKGKIPFKDK